MEASTGLPSVHLVPIPLGVNEHNVLWSPCLYSVRTFVRKSTEKDVLSDAFAP